MSKGFIALVFLMMIIKSIKIIIVILLILAWIYPFHYGPWTVAENEFFTMLIPAILSLGLLKYKYLKTNEFIYLPLVILFVSSLQYLVIDYYFLEDLIVVSIYVMFIVLMLLCSKVYLTEKNINYALKVLIFLCFINSIIVLFQYLDIKNIFIFEHSGQRRFYANIGQPNHLSTLFLMGIVSSLILYKREKIKLIVLYIISVYLTFFIFLTGSRTGFLTLIFLMFFGIIFGKIDNIKFNFRFFGILNLIYVIASYSLINNSRNTTVNIGQTLNDSRLLLWSDSISSILANPWIGYGINGVRTSRLFGDLNFKVPYVSSHNIFIDFLLWFGVIGGGICFLYSLKILKKYTRIKLMDMKLYYS